jgi:2-haloacid dehalogenase
MTPVAPPRAVVFDLGGVLIRWDPAPAIAAAVGQERARALLTHDEFDFLAWNDAQDRGRAFDEAEAEAIAAFPHLAEELRAYRANFAESLVGELEDAVAILRELHGAGVPLFALTNFSAETFPLARDRFEWLTLFDEVVVSGAEGMGKPDPAVFRLLEQRTGIPLRECVFVDDSARNVEGARAVGLDAILFTDTGHLRGDLVSRGLPLAPPVR